jgi:hypothetical protein
MMSFEFDPTRFRPGLADSTEPLKRRLVVAKFLTCLAILFLCSFGALAQQSGKKSNLEVETNWPGIQFRFDRIERILDERLLVVIRIVATAKAPPAGTLISAKPVPPRTQESAPTTLELAPFSLASSVMIDDLTAQRFPALPPIFPPGREYAPAEILAHFSPGRAEVLTLQFKVPPSALRPVNPGSEKQTVSFLLTNAKAPISGVPIPPPNAQESVRR